MKKINSMLDEYSESHQNRTNKIVHKFCVPTILFSVIGLILLIPTPSFLGDLNWALISMSLVFLYYLRLSIKYALLIIPVFILMYFGNLYLFNNDILLFSSVIIFVISWAAQFWGHKIEGKKPSFLKDIFFLLIGPLWVLKTSLNLKD